MIPLLFFSALKLQHFGLAGGFSEDCFRHPDNNFDTTVGVYNLKPKWKLVPHKKSLKLLVKILGLTKKSLHFQSFDMLTW